MLQPTHIGIPDHPCDQYSYWRTFTFHRSGCNLQSTNINIGITGTGPFVISFNGILRTTSAEFAIIDEGYEDYEFDATFDYEVCRCPDEVVR